METTAKNKLNKSTILPILLCWLTYTTAYLGRNTYPSCITLIKEFYNVTSDAEIALPTTLFFFVYGAGQIINGIFCKKYNKKYLISASLIISSVLNLIIFFGIPFKYIKYVWFFNGLMQSFLWTSLIFLLSKTLKSKDLSKAVVIMGTTVATGTFLIYGASSLFAIWKAFKFTFLLASVLMTFAGVFWLIKYDVAFAVQQEEKEEKEEKKVIATTKKIDFSTIILIILLGVFAIINNFVKDGVSTWTPSILKHTYMLPDSVSIILSIILPIFGFFSAFFNTAVQKKVKSFILQAGIWYAFGALSILFVVIFIESPLWVIVLISLALTSLFMLCVNNVVTSISPLYLRDKVNSGFLAGLLNSLCYTGSTISTYCLAAIKDATGDWSTSFILLLILCSFAVVVSLIYSIVGVIKSNELTKQKNGSL